MGCSLSPDPPNLGTCLFRNLHNTKPTASTPFYISQHEQILRQLKERGTGRKMGSTKVLFLVVLVLVGVCVGLCKGCSSDELVSEAKSTSKAAFNEAKDKTQSLADKASQNFGSENDHGRQMDENMKSKVEDAFSRATEAMKSTASEVLEYASQKASDARDSISRAAAYGGEQASVAYVGDGEIIKMATDRATDAKGTVQEAASSAQERIADTYEDAKQYSVSDKASTMAQNAKEKMNTASNMASEKFYDAKDTMADAVEYAKDKASDAYDEASERMKMTSQRTYDVTRQVKGAMDYGRDKAGDVNDEAKEKMNNMVGDKAYDARDKFGGAMEYGTGKMAETFDQAKHQVGEAYLSARNTMSNEAKAKYEAAKEKASDATGNLGAKMRNSPNL